MSKNELSTFTELFYLGLSNKPNLRKDCSKYSKCSNLNTDLTLPFIKHLKNRIIYFLFFLSMKNYYLENFQKGCSLKTLILFFNLSIYSDLIEFMIINFPRF